LQHNPKQIFEIGAPLDPSATKTISNSHPDAACVRPGASASAFNQHDQRIRKQRKRRKEARRHACVNSVDWWISQRNLAKNPSFFNETPSPALSKKN
jgi:hypothetical protein